jgi:hypothetical protein
MKRIPCVSIIENTEGEVLLSLRDNKSTIGFRNHWTLAGGKETVLKALLDEYFLSRTGSSDVHHS